MNVTLLSEAVTREKERLGLLNSISTRGSGYVVVTHRRVKGYAPGRIVTLVFLSTPVKLPFVPHKLLFSLNARPSGVSGPGMSPIRNDGVLITFVILF